MSNGWDMVSHIIQGTREKTLLSPLVVLIYFELYEHQKSIADTFLTVFFYLRGYFKESRTIIVYHSIS